MIDTVEQQTTCKACGKPLTQSRGHRQRLYCDDVCKMRYRRSSKGQQSNGVTIGVTNDDSVLQTRIAELEQEAEHRQHGLEQVQERFRQYVRMTNEKQSDQVGELVRLQKRIAELEHENARIVEQAGLLRRYRDDQAATTPKKARGKKREEGQPLPAELVYWRHFANLHGVSQNALTDAVSRGFIHLVHGAWRMEESAGYVTQALDQQGQHEFWIQFHASDQFRPCDACPH